MENNAPLTRQSVISHIKNNSSSLADLKYVKRTNTQWDLRITTKGNTFVLVTYDGGEKGFEVYYPSNLQSIADVKDQFDKYCNP